MRIASVQIVFSSHTTAGSRYFMVYLLVGFAPYSVVTTIGVQIVA